MKNNEYISTISLCSLWVRRGIALLLVAVMFILLCPDLLCPVWSDMYHVNAADQEAAENAVLYVDGDKNTLKVLNLYYDNNRYLSVRDVANALIGTKKHFEVSVGASSMGITTGTDYISPYGNTQPFPADAFEIGNDYRLNLKYNQITKDGREVKYATIIGSVNGYYDCFMDAIDLAMCLDLDIWMEGEDFYIDTNNDFTVDPEKINEDGYFASVGGVLCGDATTGEIYYSCNGKSSLAMASTTKLMTYILTMDAISSGKLNPGLPVTISETVSRLSYDTDGVIRMTAGQQTTVADLLYAILLPSSNESAKMLAELVAGSEEEFVKLMNDKAYELGMTEGTIFYNSHGLPCYIDSITATKNQNHTTPEDMFKLTQHLFKVYPQVTDITSRRSISLESLGITVSNTNPLLMNIPNVVGLKTGTTNRAGNCLVSAVKAEAEDGVHYLVAIEYGAETSYTRLTMSELLLRYALQCFNDKEVNSHGSAETKEDNESCEKLIRYILEATHVSSVPDEIEEEYEGVEG